MADPILLGRFKVAAKAHQKLEKVLAEGKHPAAECRDTPENEIEVWSGPASAIREGQAPVVSLPPPIQENLTETDLERLAEKIAKRLKGGG